MLQLFKKKLNQLSLFWRYLFLFALMCVTFIVALISANNISSQSLQSTFFQQTQDAFYHNCDNFSNQLFRNSSIPAVIETSEHYLPASVAAKPLTPKNQLHFSYLQGTFGNQCFITGTSKAFIYFDTSGVCVTADQLFLDAEQCFSTYTAYNESVDVLSSIRQMLQGPPFPVRQIVLPAASVTSYGMPDTHITLLIRPANRTQVYAFLYSEQFILEQFHFDTLPDGAYIKFVANDGSTLFSYGQVSEREHFTVFSAPLTHLSCKAVIGIPQSYFQNATRQAQARTIPIFLVSIFLGIIMCFVFSHTSVSPFRRLIRDHAATGSTNELVAIGNYMKTAHEKNAAMQSMLLSSLVVRIFSGIPIHDREYESLSSFSPLFNTPMRAAILRDRTLAKANGFQNSMLAPLQNYLSEEFLCEFINAQETILLFPDVPHTFNHLQCVLQDINGDCDAAARFVCGVSSPFTGLTALSDAIHQAQFCVPEDDLRVLACYSESSQSTANTSRTDFSLKYFQQTLARWDEKATLEQIDHLAQIISHNNQVDPEEIYYHLLHILRQVMSTSSLSLEEKDLPYQHTVSPSSNLRRLKTTLESLFRQRASIQSAEQEQLRQDIVAYIQANFSDPNLCSFSIAQHFSTSERFVQRTIQASTQMNFNEFVTFTRMEKAAHLLKETDIPINIVAEKCGYYVRSTFYRNFRKHFRVTPLEFKENQRQPETTN